MHLERCYWLCVFEVKGQCLFHMGPLAGKGARLCVAYSGGSGVPLQMRPPVPATSASTKQPASCVPNPAPLTCCALLRTGAYATSLPGYPADLYVSNKVLYEDKLMLAASWLYRATGELIALCVSFGWEDGQTDAGRQLAVPCHRSVSSLPGRGLFPVGI